MFGSGEQDEASCFITAVFSTNKVKLAKKNCENNSGFMVLEFVIGSGEQDRNNLSYSLQQIKLNCFSENSVWKLMARSGELYSKQIRWN